MCGGLTNSYWEIVVDLDSPDTVEGVLTLPGVLLRSLIVSLSCMSFPRPEWAEPGQPPWGRLSVGVGLNCLVNSCGGGREMTDPASTVGI